MSLLTRTLVPSASLHSIILGPSAIFARLMPVIQLLLLPSWAAGETMPVLCFLTPSGIRTCSSSHTFVVFLKPTVLTRPSVLPLWLTQVLQIQPFVDIVHIKGFYLLTYLLTSCTAYYLCIYYLCIYCWRVVEVTVVVVECLFSFCGIQNIKHHCVIPLV